MDGVYFLLPNLSYSLIFNGTPGKPETYTDPCCVQKCCCWPLQLGYKNICSFISKFCLCHLTYFGFRASYENKKQKDNF